MRNVAITGRTSAVSVTVTLVGLVTSVNVTTEVQQRSPVAHPMGQTHIILSLLMIMLIILIWLITSIKSQALIEIFQHSV